MPNSTPELTSKEQAIWAARKERAKRWRPTDLRSEPTVTLDEETAETLSAEPPEDNGKKKG